MDRSSAATTLLLWQLQGEAEFVRQATVEGDGTLLSLVEAAAREHPPPPPRRVRPRPVLEILRLDEETSLEALRNRVKGLASVLPPADAERIAQALQEPLLPAAKIALLDRDVDRLASRPNGAALQRDFEALLSLPPPRPRAPSPIRGLLLFTREGRLVASEGEADVNLAALAELVVRGEPGSTWSLNHKVGVIIGHIGDRAGLVAVFRTRPDSRASGTLRSSIASLEQGERLANALGHPSSHGALSAYLRAVRLLLQKAA